jgi:hypothetical protein
MKMIKDYELQNANIKGVLRTYFKLSIVNCQLSIINETSNPGLLGIPNYIGQNYKPNDIHASMQSCSHADIKGFGKSTPLPTTYDLLPTTYGGRNENLDDSKERV